MIQKIISHWTERPSCVLAESVLSFEVQLNVGAIIKRHLGFPVSPGPQAPLGQNLGGCGGRGEVRRWGVAKKKRSVLETCRNLLFSPIIIIIFSFHVSNNIKLSWCYTSIPTQTLGRVCGEKNCRKIALRFISTDAFLATDANSRGKRGSTFTLTRDLSLPLFYLRT